jgi:uncharacterized repeat protein (TIGR03803 family)
VYSINVNGTAFTVLHSFSGQDGATPETGVALDGAGNLYGTTVLGGANNSGTVFKVKSNGSAFSTLHSFQNGSYPFASLLVAAGSLYGTGAAGGGEAAYSMNTDGTNFSFIRSFASAGGGYPRGSLVRDGTGYLYGATSPSGMLGSLGTIFKIREDGTGFLAIHSFSDGASTSGTTMVIDNDESLYGMTACYVFKMKNDGSNFSKLHQFADCATPAVPLLLGITGDLYGATPGNGTFGLGLVFTLKRDGNGFKALHSFAGGSTDGANPVAPLVQDGAGNLYGTTFFGGSAGYGTAFIVKPDGSGFALLHSFDSDGAYPNGGLALDEAGFLYGTTSQGGPSWDGVVFSLRSDGSNFAILHPFSGLDGARPNGALTLDSYDNLFGMTSRGGASDYGTVFTLKTSGASFSLLRSFSGFPSDGEGPAATITPDGFGGLFGTTVWGGALGGGTVFKLNPTAAGNGALTAPVINAPSEGQVVTTSHVSLAWGGVTGAGGYDLRVVDISTGLTMYSGELTSLNSAVDLPSGGLTFGVRACSGGFADANCGPFATVDFTVNVLPPTSSSTKFYTLTPCRVADTRNAPGLYGGPALQAGVTRVFTLAGQCGIPNGTKAVSVNLTIVKPTADGTLKITPTGVDPTAASSISFSAGWVRANNAIVFMGNDGAINVFDAQDDGSTNFIIDTNGYFK